MFLVFQDYKTTINYEEVFFLIYYGHNFNFYLNLFILSRKFTLER